MLKEIAELTNYKLEDEKDFDLAKFKAHLDANYILKENVDKDEELKKKITGQTFGKMYTKLAKDFGLKSSEVDGKPYEEVFALVKSKHEAQINEVKTAAANTPDERVVKLQTELENERTAKTDLEKALEETKANSEKALTEKDGQLKSIKLNTLLEKEFGNVSFVDEYHKDPLKKAGFNAIISQKYRFGLDENDKPIATDAEGKPVKHPKKTGHFAEIADILLMEAENNGLLKKNTAETVTRKIGIRIGGENAEADAKKVHANARKHEQKLAERGY